MEKFPNKGEAVAAVANWRRRRYKQNHKKTMFHAYSIAKTALSKMKSTLMDAIFSDENLL